VRYRTVKFGSRQPVHCSCSDHSSNVKVFNISDLRCVRKISDSQELNLT
jgi:hypothetical protein